MARTAGEGTIPVLRVALDISTAMFLVASYGSASSDVGGDWLGAAPASLATVQRTDILNRKDPIILDALRVGGNAGAGSDIVAGLGDLLRTDELNQNVRQFWLRKHWEGLLGHPQPQVLPALVYALKEKTMSSLRARGRSAGADWAGGEGGGGRVAVAGGARCLPARDGVAAAHAKKVEMRRSEDACFCLLSCRLRFAFAARNVNGDWENNKSLLGSPRQAGLKTIPAITYSRAYALPWAPDA